jgi:hypothetical protein
LLLSFDSAATAGDVTIEGRAAQSITSEVKDFGIHGKFATDRCG